MLVHKEASSYFMGVILIGCPLGSELCGRRQSNHKTHTIMQSIVVVVVAVVVVTVVVKQAIASEVVFEIVLFVSL